MFAVQTAIMQLMYISLMNIWIYSVATIGNAYSLKNHQYSLKKKKDAWLAPSKGVALGSDAFFPFGDNIERAHKSGVEFVAQSGGSIRDDNVIETCDKYNMAMAFVGIRLFHH